LGGLNFQVLEDPRQRDYENQNKESKKGESKREGLDCFIVGKKRTKIRLAQVKKEEEIEGITKSKEKLRFFKHFLLFFVQNRKLKYNK